MKIDCKNEYVHFGDIVIGECFEYSQNFYMKVHQAHIGDLILNAVNLNENKLCTIDLYRKVRSVNLKIVNDDKR